MSKLKFVAFFGAILNVLSSAQIFPFGAAIADMSRIADVVAYGARCDGVADDATAINAAIASAYTSNGRWGGVVRFPAGQTCVVRSTLKFTDRIGGILEGNGATLMWIGNRTDPMIRVQGVQFATFRNLFITNKFGTFLAVGIESVNNGTILGSPTRNTYENIVIKSSLGTPNIGKGWQFALGSGGDDQNDLNTFIADSVVYYTVAGWSFEHSQSVGHSFYNCQADANGQTGTIGVATTLGSGNAGGSFNWYGGNLNGNMVADFRIGALTGSPMTISGAHSEYSYRFFEMTTGAASLTKPVALSNNEYADSALAADKYAIVFNGMGPFTMTGNRFSGSVTGLMVKLNSSGAATELNMTGNVWSMVNSATQANIVFTTGGGTFRINRSGNSYANGFGTPMERADDIISAANGGTGMAFGDQAGTIALSAATPGIASHSLAYTYATAPICVAQEVTDPTKTVSVTSSVSALAFSGTNGHTVKWVCHGAR